MYFKDHISYHVVYFSGVGKTTLAKTLSTELSCKVFVEPATENPYLEKFYKQPNKFALPLQLWILQQRYHTYVNATKHVLNTGMNRYIYSYIISWGPDTIHVI